MSVKRTRTEATIAEKLDLLERFKKLPKMSEWKAAEALNVKRGFLRGVIQNEEKLRAEVAKQQTALWVIQNEDKIQRAEAAKKQNILKDPYNLPPKPRIDTLNPAMVQLPESDPIALQKKMSLENFKPSNGWLSRWKVRYGLEWPQQVPSTETVDGGETDTIGVDRHNVNAISNLSSGDTITRRRSLSVDRHSRRRPRHIKSTSILCDEYSDSIRVVDPSAGFSNYGGISRFAGTVVTVKCYEDNSNVIELSKESGIGKVLVVDGGGSRRRALLGGLLALQFLQKQWEGIVIYGSIRDVDEIQELSLRTDETNKNDNGTKKKSTTATPTPTPAPTNAGSKKKKDTATSKAALDFTKKTEGATPIATATTTGTNERFLGVQALGTCPQRATKHVEGQIQIPVTFASVTIYPGDFIVCDNDGIVVNSKPMNVELDR